MLSVHACSLISSCVLIPPSLLPHSFSAICLLPGCIFSPPLYVFLHSPSCSLFLLVFMSEICLSAWPSVLLILPAPSFKFLFCHVSLFSCLIFTFTDSLPFRSCFKVLKFDRRLSFLFLCHAGGRLPTELVPKEEQQQKEISQFTAIFKAFWIWLGNMAESHIASWSYIAFFKGCQRKKWNTGTKASKPVPCLVQCSNIVSRQHANTYCNGWIHKCQKLPLDQKCCSIFLTVNLFYEFLQIYSEIRIWLTGIIFD